MHRGTHHEDATGLRSTARPGEPAPRPTVLPRSGDRPGHAPSGTNTRAPACGSGAWRHCPWRQLSQVHFSHGGDVRHSMDRPHNTACSHPVRDAAPCIRHTTGRRIAISAPRPRAGRSSTARSSPVTLISLISCPDREFPTSSQRYQGPAMHRRSTRCLEMPTACSITAKTHRRRFSPSPGIC